MRFAIVVQNFAARRNNHRRVEDFESGPLLIGVYLLHFHSLRVDIVVYRLSWISVVDFRVAYDSDAPICGTNFLGKIIANPLPHWFQMWLYMIQGAVVVPRESQFWQNQEIYFS